METTYGSTRSAPKKLHVRTPLIESLELKDLCSDREVYLKLENTQPSGSFKLRGIGLRCIQALNEGYEELVCASGGNAGVAVAYSARKLGLKARVFIPQTSDPRVHEILVKEGAAVEVVGTHFAEANERALLWASRESGSCFVHPFDHPTVWEGNSTIIEELAEDLGGRKPAAILVSCGGGGLACGILRGLEKQGWFDTIVLIVETTGADSYHQMTVAGGEVVTLPGITSLAKTLGSTVVCERLAEYYRCGQFKMPSLLVSDRDAAEACHKFAASHRMLVELSCGAALAPIHIGSICQILASHGAGPGPLVAIVCGGVAVSPQIMEEWKVLLGMS